MRMIFGLVLIVGIALAGAAVYMAKGYINKTEFALQEELKIKARTGGLVELFVVNKPKNYGEQLTKDDVQMIYWPKNALPEAAFFDPAVLFPAEKKPTPHAFCPAGRDGTVRAGSGHESHRAGRAGRAERIDRTRHARFCDQGGRGRLPAAGRSCRYLLDGCRKRQ